MNIMAALMALNSIIDPETLQLFSRFVEKARTQKDPNAWLKEQLRLILDKTAVIVEEVKTRG